MYTIRQRKAQNPVLSSPGKKRPRRKPKTKDLPGSMQMEVRNTLYNMYQESNLNRFMLLIIILTVDVLEKHVTLRTLKDELENKQLVEIGTTSLSVLLKEIGFKYKRDDNRRALTERLNITVARSVFLRKYIENLNSNFRRIVFLDETWIFSKGTKTKSWQDDNIKSVRKPEGYDGKRFIIVHAGTADGFIDGASLIFPSKSTTGDYHGDMNSELFKQWTMEKLIPNLEEPSLVILDNAPYHSVVLNKPPNTSSKKSEIIEWLQDNQINYATEMSKVELLQLVKIHSKEKNYEIDELLRKSGHEVLRLPPYHCDFNAIELIWAKTKNYYNTHIGRNGYTDDKVNEMWNEALNTCDGVTWSNCVRHTEDLIKKWYEREYHLQNLNTDPFIIHVGESSSESESDSSN